MSGIVGIYYLDGRPVERTDVERMVDSISHRGPDGSGVWTDGSVGLGHRMLWTTPESLHEKLPLTNKSGDLTITADARIDNRDELFSILNFNGRPRETIADSELILAAYEKWGEKCPEKLLGDFSFAIWDKRRQTIFCARDHMGVKPFYYYHSDKVFVFASEIKALLSQPEVPRRLNEVRVADYLVKMDEYADRDITFYKNILRLPPGYMVTTDYKKILIRSYWSLDPSQEVKFKSNDEYAEAFRDIFMKAVSCRLRSAFPVGSMLSGGLDSSSVTCVTRKLFDQDGDKPLYTFSVIFEDGPEYDESRFVAAVLAAGKIKSYTSNSDQMIHRCDLENILVHEDEPLCPPNLFIDWELSSAAKQQGVRVLLDGIDGDTTVSHGLAYLTELLRKCRWKTLATELISLSRNFNRSPWTFFLSYSLSPLIPRPIHRAWHTLKGRNRDGQLGSTMINPNFAERIGLSARVQAMLEKEIRLIKTSKGSHWYQLTNNLIPGGLEIKEKVATAFHIDSRHPFCDRRLVEFCLSLPPQQKLHQGWTRIIMRRAFADILPKEIRERSGKSSMSPEFIRRLLTFNRSFLEEAILNNPKCVEPYVDTTAMGQAYHRYTTKETENDGMNLWDVMTFSLWLRRNGLAS